MKWIFGNRIFVLWVIALPACTTVYRAERLEPQKVLETLNSLPPHGLKFSLAQAQALAVLQHPSLRKLRAERGFVEAAEIRVDLRPDPELSISPFWIIPEATLGSVASLSWEILPSGTKEARRGLAAALRDSVDAKIAEAEWRIAQETRIAWLELLRAENIIHFSAQSLALSQEARDFGRSMLERGAARDVDVAVLELDFAEAERELISAKAMMKTSREHLAKSMGLAPGSNLEITAVQNPFETSEVKLPEGNTDDALLQRLPQLREAYSQYLIAEKELELAYLDGLPKLSIGPDTQRDADNTFLGAGASITIPSTDANRVGIAEAKTRREIAAKNYEEILFESRAAVAKALAEEEASSQAFHHHESTVAPRAKQTLDAADRAVNAGVSDLLSLLLARERALRAERVGLELRASHAIAIANLEAAFGPEPLQTQNGVAQ